jgi:hypothetical protein
MPTPAPPSVVPVQLCPMQLSFASTARNATQDNALLGWSASSAGDVNGDGFMDLIVGSPYEDNGQVDEGRAFLYIGSASGLSATPVWSFESNIPNAYLGTSVAIAGDINGDGFADVVIGAPHAGSGMRGAVYVFYGSSTGLSAQPAWSVEGPQSFGGFGQSVASAGDVNGDGFADIIVGIPSRSNGQVSEGSAYVYYGSARGLASTPQWIAESNVVSALFGTSVAAAGDINHDGFGDVLIGAPQESRGVSGEGRAYLFLGGVRGLATTPVWSATGGVKSGQFGISVAGAGDVNGDGFSDILVGHHNYNDSAARGGRAVLFLGSATGPSTTPSWSMIPQAKHQAQFGYSLASAGDLNGDGYGDVIIGARGYQPTVRQATGGAFVYLGSPQGLGSCASWWATSNQAGSIFGASVGAAGDVNGDGRSDLLVGAPYSSLAKTWGGTEFVYLNLGAGVAGTTGTTQTAAR